MSQAANELATASEKADIAAPALTSDAEITAAISAAVHEAFRALWRRHEDKAWRPIRRTLEQVVAAHEEALAELPARGDSGSDDGTSTEQAFARYRRGAARGVLKPLHVVLRHAPLAAPLQRSLESATEQVREAVAELPSLVRAPVSPAALERHAGQGAAMVAKRLCARALRPIVWRHEAHDVPVARIARQHLGRDVLPRQNRAFRASQRGRAVWLGRLERAWSAWIEVVLSPQRPDTPEESERDDTEAHHDAGAELQSELRALLDEVSQASGREAGEDFTHLTNVLSGTIAVAGTFVATPPSAKPPGRDYGALARRWDEWADQTAARLELYRVLLAVRSGTDAIGRRLVDDWNEIVRTADSVLAEVEAELREGHARAATLPGDGPGLPGALVREQARTAEGLNHLADTLQDPERFARALTAEADEAVEDLEALSLQLPKTLTLHDIPEPGETVRGPGRDARVVEIREAAVQAFDTLRMERIRTAPSGVTDAMHRVRSEVAELREVSAYGYEAAIAELSGGDDPESGHAVVLVTDALSRAGDKVGVARGALHEALRAAGRQADDEVGDGADRLIQRVTADRLTAGYLDARSYLVTEVAGDWKRWRGRLAWLGSRTVAGLRAAGARLRPLATVLGIRPPARGATDLSEHTLASAAQFVRTLPVVYQRLFAFEPLTDPRLLAGRDDALAEITASWTRWKSGGPGSLVVVTPPGAGITSFLNIAATRLSDEAPHCVRRILRERIQEENQLAALLAAWLGLGETDDLDEAHDLDGLAGRLLDAPDGTIPRLVILESAEHLHLRAPGGGDLFERLVTFMSRTESRVFWIVSLTSSAWQLVRTRAPAFVRDLKRLVLDPLAPDELRQAIIARHLRSGLPLQYAEPSARREALRNRARRIHRSDKQQQLIEKNYFERLSRASLGSIRLALFHWLRSADFTTVEGSLLVQPLEPLNPLMDMLDITQSFALKAILDHGTLTVDEYREVARASADEGLHTFRSLADQHVIELIPGGGEGSGRRPPGPKARYRIPPLMIGAVTAHLRSRNILH